MKTYIVLAFSILSFSFAQAQKIELGDDPSSIEVQRSNKTPRTGKGAAQKFFTKEASANKESSVQNDSSSDDHYLTIGLSFFIDSTSYRWGPSKFEDPAKWALSVSYRMGEWVNSTDLIARIEFQKYDFDASKSPKKISFVPVIIFPDSRSTFPLYFGGGAGLGILFDQFDNESTISLDYTLFAGARLFNIVGNTGFFIESGLKNHIHLLSSGQLNGYYFTLGTVHTF